MNSTLLILSAPFGILQFEGMAESFELILSGFGIVMLTLVGLWITIAVVGKLFSAAAQSAAKKAEQTGAPVPLSGVAGEYGLSSQTLVMIAAAVHTTVQGRYRIVGIEHRPSSHELANVSISSWSVEGRRAIFSSHRIR